MNANVAQTPAPTGQTPAPAGQTPAPSTGGVPKRRLRNYLLDARFQLKFTSYILVIALLVAGVTGFFLWSTAQRLMKEAERSVAARSKAAETSRELSAAMLNNQLVQHLNDPAFDKQLQEQSAQIDRQYDEEHRQIVEQKQELEKRQRHVWWILVGCLVGFVVFITGATIVTTHRIVGPLFRIKRMVLDVGEGKLGLPKYPLRQGDELHDLFDAITTMLQGLRRRQLEDAQALERWMEHAKRDGVSPALVSEISALHEQLRGRVD